MSSSLTVVDICMMNDFYTLPLERKRLILSSAETKIGLPAAAIEKDLWVTCVLQLLFSIDIHAEFLFKGGTSLSKAGNLIQRFSEDIDIAINPAFLGFSADQTSSQSVFTVCRANTCRKTP